MSSLKTPTVYQPFSVVHRYGKLHVHNESGARGSNYSGEKIRIAAIGSSSAYSFNINQQDTWTEQLLTYLPPDIHIESYGLESTGDLDLVDLLKNFEKTGKSFDLIIILHNFGLSHRQSIFRNTSSSIVTDFDDLRSRLLNFMLFNCNNSIICHFISKNLFPRDANQKPLSFLDRTFRNNPDNKHLFKFKETKVEEFEIKKIFTNMKIFSELAKKVSKHQIYVNEFFAFSQNMHPSLNDKYVINHRLDRRSSFFHNKESLSLKFEIDRKMNRIASESLGLTVHQWEDYMIPAIEVDSDIFLDEIHLDVKGARLFSRQLSVQIKEMLKIYNR